MTSDGIGSSVLFSSPGKPCIYLHFARQPLQAYQMRLACTMTFSAAHSAQQQLYVLGVSRLCRHFNPVWAKLMYTRRLFKETDFPLAAVSLNVTMWTLQMVRDRRLTSAAKKQQSAVTAACDFYTGAFYTLYNHWKTNKCTMADSGNVLKEVEKLACNNKKDMITKAGTKL